MLLAGSIGCREEPASAPPLDEVFERDPQAVVPVTGAGPDFVSIGDLDADGIPDLVTVNLITEDLSVHRGFGDGTFEEVTVVDAGLGEARTSLADLDGDGALDVACANTDGDDVAVLLGEGGGALGSPAAFPAGDEPSGVAIGDVDRDGTLDLVVTAVADGAAVVLGSDGGGGFEPGTAYPVDASEPSHPLRGDLDGDGRLALVLTDFLGRLGASPKTERGNVRFAQFLAFGIGLFVVLGSVFMKYIPGNITAMTNKTVNLLTTPIFGLFFFALFVPFAKPVGAWAGAVCGTITAALIAFSGPLVVLLSKLNVDPATFGVELIKQTDPGSGAQWLEASEDPISFQWIGPVAIVVNIAVGTLVSWVWPRKQNEES